MGPTGPMVPPMQSPLPQPQTQYQCAARSKVYDTMSQLANVISQRLKLNDCTPPGVTPNDVQVHMQQDLDNQINQLRDQLKKDKLNAPPMPGLGHRGTGTAQEQNIGPDPLGLNNPLPGTPSGPGTTGPGLGGPGTGGGPIPVSPGTGHNPIGSVPLPDTGLPNPHPDALDDTPPDLNSGSPYAVPIDPSSLQTGLVPKDQVKGADPTCQAPVQNGKPFFSLAPNGTMQQCVCTPQTVKPAALSSSGLCGPPTWSVDVKHKAKCQTWVFEGPENPDTLDITHQKSIFNYGPPNPAGRPWKDCAQGYQLTSVIKQGAPYTLIFEPSIRPVIPGTGSYYSYASVKRQVLNDTAPPAGVPLCNFDTVQVSNNQNVFEPNWVKSSVSMQTLSDWTPFESTWTWSGNPDFSRISLQFQFQHSQPTDCWENSIVWLRYYMQFQQAIASHKVQNYLHSTQGLPTNSLFAGRMAWVVSHDPDLQRVFDKVSKGDPHTFHQVMLQPPISDLFLQTFAACVEAEGSSKCLLANSALNNALRSRRLASTEYGFSGDYGGYDYATPYQQYSADNDFSLDGQNDYSWDSFVHSANRDMDRFVDATTGWMKNIGHRKHSTTEYGYSGDNDFSFDGHNDYSWDSFVNDMNRGMDKFVDATAGWTRDVGRKAPAPPPPPPPPPRPLTPEERKRKEEEDKKQRDQMWQATVAQAQQEWQETWGPKPAAKKLQQQRVCNRFGCHMVTVSL
ncbi:hypothetical protein RI367_002611 [Sorochytrium milnesiophthora]